MCKDLFKKEADMNLFVGLKVQRTSNGDEGIIESSFGKAGKFKVYFSQGNQQDKEGHILLRYKRYLFRDNNKKLLQ
jgi:hypothetical protein